MIYIYLCPACGEQYEVYQRMNDKHVHFCERCGIQCKRVFIVPHLKKNEGFFSLQLGKYVRSQTEFNEELDRLRYLHDLQDNLGDNRTPKDEWVEQKAKKDQANLERIKRDMEEMERIAYEKEKKGNIDG